MKYIWSLLILILFAAPCPAVEYAVTTSACYSVSGCVITGAGSAVTGTSAFVRGQVTPQIIKVRQCRQSGICWDEDQLNRVPSAQYPASVGDWLWQPVELDHYGADPAQRAELWADSAGTLSWAEIKQIFPSLPGLLEAAARQWGEAQAKFISSPYSESEQKTWPYQREEAKAWEADHNAPTPYCDGLAAARGVPRELFMQKVRENTDLFEYYSKWIFGNQQHLIDLIHYASTLAAITEFADTLGLSIMERARKLGGVQR